MVNHGRTSFGARRPSRRRFRKTYLLGLLLVLDASVGCGASNTEELPEEEEMMQGNERCLDVELMDGEATETLELGVVEAGQFQAWQDGDELEVEWGSQGANMIQPIVRFAEGLTGCTEITLTNEMDPDSSEGFEDVYPMGFSLRRPLTPFDGGPIVGPLNNEISNTNVDARIVLRAIARGEDFVAEGSVRLRVFEPAPTGPCADLERRGNGCSYVIFPGRGVVIDDGDTPEGAIRFEFTPDDPSRHACHPLFGELEGTHTVDRPCEGATVPIGTEFAAELQVIERGTCTPEIGVPLDLCEMLSR